MPKHMKKQTEADLRDILNVDVSHINSIEDVEKR